MERNKYKDRILSMGKKTGARIILPESEDQRIREAIVELNSLGFNVVQNEEFQDKTERYMDYLSTLPFTNNWPAKNLREYLQNPLHFSIAILACDDVDGVIAGAVTSSSEVIRTAIRIVGINSSSNWVSSIFFLISPNGDHAYTSQTAL